MIIIAIDGYSCTGKSTISTKLGKILGLKVLNSGLIYRYFGYLLIKKGITPICYLNNSKEIKSIILDSKLNIKTIEKLEKELKKKQYSEIGKLLAEENYSREKINSLLRKFATKDSFIVEGRDIGTTVFPKAEFKFFFTADIETRALRKSKERNDNDIEKIKKEIKERDSFDSNRKNSPLRKHQDAIEIDTSKMSPSEIIKKIIDVIKK